MTPLNQRFRIADWKCLLRMFYGMELNCRRNQFNLMTNVALSRADGDGPRELERLANASAEQPRPASKASGAESLS
jgi:hypothetical protein